jgi:hypothetical protein
MSDLNKMQHSKRICNTGTSKEDCETRASNDLLAAARNGTIAFYWDPTGTFGANPAVAGTPPPTRPKSNKKKGFGGIDVLWLLLGVLLGGAVMAGIGVFVLQRRRAKNQHAWGPGGRSQVHDSHQYSDPYVNPYDYTCGDQVTPWGTQRGPPAYDTYHVFDPKLPSAAPELEFSNPTFDAEKPEFQYSNSVFQESGNPDKTL